MLAIALFSMSMHADAANCANPSIQIQYSTVTSVQYYAAKTFIMENEAPIMGACSLATNGISKQSYFLQYSASVTRRTAVQFFSAYTTWGSSSMQVSVTLSNTSSMTVSSRQITQVKPMMMSTGATNALMMSSKNNTQMLSFVDAMGVCQASACTAGDNNCHIFKILPLDMPPNYTLVSSPSDPLTKPGRKLMDGGCCDGLCGSGVSVGTCSCPSSGSSCNGCFVPGGCPSCFPSTALVEVLGKGPIPMDQLSYGDKVRSVLRSTGAIAYREVYLFGHRLNSVTRKFIELKTNSGATLQLTHRHFIPVCRSGCDDLYTAAREMVYAKDVKAGDNVFVSPKLDQTKIAEVVSTSEIVSLGAFSPFVFGADLIVDGVVASPHSNWILDDIVPRSAVKWLPAIYEALISPIYLTYVTLSPLLGCETARWLAEDLALADIGANPVGYAAIILAGPLAMYIVKSAVKKGL